MKLIDLLEIIFLFNKINIFENHGEDEDLKFLCSGLKYDVPEELKSRKVLMIEASYGVFNVMVDESEDK